MKSVSSPSVIHKCNISANLTVCIGFQLFGGALLVSAGIDFEEIYIKEK